MKKIILITSLCSLGIVTVTTPIVINCSKNTITQQNYYYVDCVDLPTKLNACETISTRIYLKASSGKPITGVKWTIVDDAGLNAEIDDYNCILTITPTNEMVNRNIELKLKAVFFGNEIVDVSYSFNNIVYTNNIMLFNGCSYALADNIRPNLFVTRVNNTTTHSIEQIPLKDGSTIEIGRIIGNN